MNDSVPSTTLPNLAAIFRGIKAGRHWCFGDLEYSDLNGGLFDAYRDFFGQLNLTLHRDPRGFVFATDEDADDDKGNDRISKYVVLTAVWVDALADQGRDIGKSIFADRQRVEDLPHFASEGYRRSMEQVGISSLDELQGILKGLERQGFVDWSSDGRFTPRPAFHRFLDVCLAAKTATDGAGYDTTAADEQAGEIPAEEGQL